jgi:hypothetical protein
MGAFAIDPGSITEGANSDHRKYVARAGSSSHCREDLGVRSINGDFLATLFTVYGQAQEPY